MRTVQQQASQSGVGILNTSRQMTYTNDAFFIEQVQNITVVATDAQLVDFLYKLGSGASMIRVRDLELQPDASHLHLTANIRLVASYQKKPLAATPLHSRKQNEHDHALPHPFSGRPRAAGPDATNGEHERAGHPAADHGAPLRTWQPYQVKLSFPALGMGNGARRGPLGALPPGQPPGPNFPNQPGLPQPQNQLPVQNNLPGLPALNNPAVEETVPPGFINFQGVDVNQVLEVYAQLVGRTLLRASLPQASIVLKTQTALTKKEAIEALEAVLALNNISVINVGDKFVKVEQSDQANTAAAELDQSDTANLPELGSYVTHIVQLKFIKPSEMVPIIQPFAKLQNSILPIDSNGILVLRDYVPENVRAC